MSENLWSRVRRWLITATRRDIPRPHPVLLEDLYPPAATSVYRTVRRWEESVSEQLAAEQWADFLVEVNTLAQDIRRHLLLLQRLKHLAWSEGGEERQKLVWNRHNVTWSGAMMEITETLTALARELEGVDLPSNVPMIVRRMRDEMAPLSQLLSAALPELRELT